MSNELAIILLSPFYKKSKTNQSIKLLSTDHVCLIIKMLRITYYNYVDNLSKLTSLTSLKSLLFSNCLSTNTIFDFSSLKKYTLIDIFLETTIIEKNSKDQCEILKYLLDNNVITISNTMYSMLCRYCRWSMCYEVSTDVINLLIDKDYPTCKKNILSDLNNYVSGNYLYFIEENIYKYIHKRLMKDTFEQLKNISL